MMRGSWRAFYWLFGGLGLLFLLGAAVSFGLITRSIDQQRTQLAATVPITAAGLSDSALGRAVYAEGRLSPRMPPRWRSLAAYQRLSYRHYNDSDGKDRVETIVLASELPPLRLDLPDGEVTVTGAYALEQPAQRVPQDGDDYVGFAAGDPLLAVGVVAPGEGGRVLSATLVTAQDWPAYLAQAQTQAGLVLMVPAIFCFLGTMFLGFGVALWRLGA